MTAKRISIVIADDHPLMLEAMKGIILGYPQFELLGSANDGAKALSLLGAHDPDIAVLDIDMPFLTGLEVIKKAKDANIHTKFILLTFHKEEAMYNKAKQLGVFGYVLKDQSTQEIIQCILHVANGEHYVSKSFLGLLQKTEAPKELSDLTKSEKAVIKLVSQEKTTNEIGDMLFISPKTVENHRSNICKKLSLDGSKNSLLTWAIKHRDALI